MSDYPDINKPEQIAVAIKNIEVLGGHSRSLSMTETGDYKPDRYIEKLGDFASDFAIKRAVQSLFDNALFVNGLDCVLIAQSRESVTFLCDDGTERVYRLDVRHSVAKETKLPPPRDGSARC